MEFTERGGRELGLVPPAYRLAVQQAIDELVADQHRRCVDKVERPGFTVHYAVDPDARIIRVTGVEHFWRMDQPRWGLIGLPANPASVDEARKRRD